MEKGSLNFLVDTNIWLERLLDQVDLIELNLKQKFDFDDAYQYQLALKFDLTLVTFDRDFKRSKVKVLNPIEAIQLYRK